ncbi:hypothetical protein IMSAGC011_00585 [Lachnospiraceae bacterium]|nr:hypothetical protein IMSAGC011_00585 [Lachnospiraceae bacterium]
MKKKIVNVILSVAVVTSMMFTVTACGSKDNDKAPAESAAVTNTVEDAANTDTEGTAQTDTANADTEDTANADTEDTAQTDTANANAEGGMTVEEWVSSEEAAQYVEVLNTTIGAMSNGMMTTEFEGEGNTLSMVFVLSAEALGTDGSDLTDEQKSEMETQMQQQFDGLKDQFQPMRDELKETIGISDLVVQIVYRTSNGTELFRHEL